MSSTSCSDNPEDLEGLMRVIFLPTRPIRMLQYLRNAHASMAVGCMSSKCPVQVGAWAGYFLPAFALGNSLRSSDSLASFHNLSIAMAEI